MILSLQVQVKKEATNLQKLISVLFIALGILLVPSAQAFAKTPSYTLTFKSDGTFEPQNLEVEAGRFKIILINDSKEAVEFESLPLRAEKVLGPGVKSFVVLTVSRPGEYPFFDEFHPDVKGLLKVLPKK